MTRSQIAAEILAKAGHVPAVTFVRMAGVRHVVITVVCQGEVIQRSARVAAPATIDVQRNLLATILARCTRLVETRRRA